jgi:hypothetical protein
MKLEMNGSLKELPFELVIPGQPFMTLTVGCQIMQLRAIDTINQLFDCRFMLIFSWKTTKSYEQIDISAETLEWKPNILFMNSKSTLLKLKEIFYKFNKGEHTNIIYKVIYDGTFIEHFELQHYPIDSQRLYIRILLTDFPISVNQTYLNSFKLLKTKTLIHDEGFTESNTWELEKDIRIEEGKTLPERNDGLIYSTINIYLTISRNVGFYIWNVMIPTVILVMCSFISFILTIDDLIDSCLITLTMLFTLIALKFSLTQYIQTTSYMTYLDKYILIAFIYISLVILQNVLMYSLSKLYHNDPDEDGDNHIKTIITINNISAFIMLGTWIVFNIIVVFIMGFKKFRLLISYPMDDKSFSKIDINNHHIENFEEYYSNSNSKDINTHEYNSTNNIRRSSEIYNQLAYLSNNNVNRYTDDIEIVQVS